MARVRALGCIACMIDGVAAAAEIHHVTEAGRRLGHYSVLPLCAWHHRAESETGQGKRMAACWFGPSLAVSKSEFAGRYGSERELLVQVERMIGNDGL